MATGPIIKLAKTFDLTLGWIKSDPGDHKVFFNESSLEDGEAFNSLAIGQTATFEAKPDQVTGAHATHLNVAASPPGADQRPS